MLGFLQKYKPSLLEFYLGVCLIATWPVIATNAAFSPISAIRWLGIGESFGWTGISMPEGFGVNGTIMVSQLLVFALLFAAASMLIVVLADKSEKRWFAILAIIPALLLAFWCKGTIGSVKKYDFSEVASWPAPEISGLWFTAASVVPPVDPGPGAVREINFRIAYDYIHAVYNSPYIIASAVLVIAYVWLFGFRRPLLMATAFASLVLSAYANWGWSGLLSWFLVSVYPVAVFLFSCAVMRLFFRGYLDNRKIISGLWQKDKEEKRPLGGLMKCSLAMWSPFFIAICIIFALGYWFQQTAERWSYDSTAEANSIFSEIPDDLLNFKNPLRAVHYENAFDKIGAAAPSIPVRLPRDDMDVVVIDAMKKAEETFNSITDVDLRTAKINVMLKFDDAVKPNLWDYSTAFRIDGNCISISVRKFRFSITCLTRDLKNSILNQFYQYPRNKLRNFVHGAVVKAVETANKANKVLDGPALAKEIKDSINASTLAMRQSLDLGWLLLAFASTASTLMLFLSGYRAFLTITARLIVNTKSKRVHTDEKYYTSMSDTQFNGAEVEPKAPDAFPSDSGALQLLPEENKAVAVTEIAKSSKSKKNTLQIELPKKAEPTTELESNGDEVFYVKGSLDVSNADRAAIWPPQIHQSFLVRFLRRRLLLRRLEFNNRLRPKITDIGSNNFVLVKIPPHVSIAFRWQNFVGMSDTIRLGTLVSMKLPMSVTGHIRIPTATGPGKLILKVTGKASISKKDVDADTVAPYRLVAWDLRTRFRVTSSASIFSLYLEDCQIDVCKGDFAVLDIAEDGRAVPGLIANLWNTLRP